MGFLSDVFGGVGDVLEDIGGDLTGRNAERAARQAAEAQTAAGQEAAALLAPFQEAGVAALDQLQGAIFQPTEITPEEILQNPFFQALSQQQAQDTLAQRAALGLGASGGTEDALTRNLLLLGEDFRRSALDEQIRQNQTRFNQLFNIASGIGLPGAGSQGNVLTDIGATEAAGIIGQQQAGAAGTQNLLNLGGQILGGLTGAPGLFGAQAPVGAGAAAGGSAGGSLLGSAVLGPIGGLLGGLF